MHDSQLQHLIKSHVNNTVDDDLQFLWLKKSYPVKRRIAAFSESFGMFLAMIGIFLVGFVFVFLLHLLDSSEPVFKMVVKAWLTLSLVSFLAWYGYYRVRTLLHKVARYYIHNRSLRFRKGYLRKSLNSFKLGQITDVYTKQAWYHMPFGLCDLVVSTASAKSVRKAYVKSMPIENAVGMQQTVLQLVEEVNTRNDDFMEEQYLKNAKPAKKQPSGLRRAVAKIQPRPKTRTYSPETMIH